MYRILIAEDDANLRRALAEYFGGRDFRVYAAQDGLEAIEIIENNEIDAAILDVMMPGKDGFEVCARLREASDIPVLFLTARASEEDQLHGFGLMADDYVTKPFSLSVLYARVQAALHRYGGRTPDSHLSVPGIEVDPASHTVIIDGVQCEMPPRVYSLLIYMMQNRGRILTREQILDHVWGEDSFIYDRAVDSTIRKLRHYLGDHSGYVHTIIKVGYRFEVNDDEEDQK